MSIFPKSGKCQCDCHKFQGHFHCFGPDCCPRAGQLDEKRDRRQYVTRFHLQETRGFPEGAPQRENYDSDERFDAACMLYAIEWRKSYRCDGCKEPECPQCGLNQPK